MKVNYDDLTYEDLTLKEEIIDYSIHNFLLVLTNRYILCIDTMNLAIIDRTLLPQKFNYLTISTDEILLISTTEIIKLNSKNLSFKGGIGIEPGDYQPMAQPILMPKTGLLYLVSHSDKKSVVKVFDVIDGMKVRSATFPRIFDFKYIPERKVFITLDSSALNFIDLKLKIIKKLKLPFSGRKFFIDKYGYIITNEQGVYWLNNEGKIIDFQPVCLSGKVQDNNFVFSNNDTILFIEPFTLRIKGLIDSTDGIRDIQALNKYQYILVNKNGDLFLLDVPKGKIERMARKESISTPLSRILTQKFDSLFYIQLNAFSERKRALNFCDSVNLPVIIDSSMDNLYRIKLGGFISKDETLEILEGMEIPGWIVYQKRVDYNIDSVFTFRDKSFYIHNGLITKKE